MIGFLKKNIFYGFLFAKNNGHEVRERPGRGKEWQGNERKKVTPF